MDEDDIPTKALDIMVADDDDPELDGLPDDVRNGDMPDPAGGGPKAAGAVDDDDDDESEDDDDKLLTDEEVDALEVAEA